MKDEDFHYLDNLSPRHISIPEHNGKILIVGDIHGCIEEFQELLDLHWSPEDVLILAGDLVSFIH